jgi:transcription initiation factor IIE alpha subunit
MTDPLQPGTNIQRPIDPVSTDEELVAKLKGQLADVRDILNELQQRELHIDLQVATDDCDTWFYRVTITRTTYL